jgi:hypothetical protein
MQNKINTVINIFKQYLPTKIVSFRSAVEALPNIKYEPDLVVVKVTKSSVFDQMTYLASVDKSTGKVNFTPKESLPTDQYNELKNEYGYSVMYKTPFLSMLRKV